MSRAGPHFKSKLTPWRVAVAAVLMLVLGATGGRAGGVDGFAPGFEDLPLMPGLEAIEAESLSFDSPAGRIVVGVAVGRVAAERVLLFYRETLPALGWRPAGGQRFIREGEALAIEFFRDDRGLTVRFSLKPAD